MDAEHLIIFSTCPDEESARRIAGTLVGEGLAACVTCLPSAWSTFRWQGQVEQQPECLLLAKTTAAASGRLESRLAELHPYELPEIVAVPISGGSPDYLAWLTAAVASPGL